ncbi:MAG: hypothetical protein EOO38_11460 [Cytophagaceae bacterium]|nr:MAG: hypothetical protein EOO38_11460 [Cytophagaceae bacterium]
MDDLPLKAESPGGRDVPGSGKNLRSCLGISSPQISVCPRRYHPSGTGTGFAFFMLKAHHVWTRLIPGIKLFVLSPVGGSVIDIEG